MVSTGNAARNAGSTPVLSTSMKAIARCDIVNKYAPPRKMEVPVSEAERKESKLAGKERTTKVIETLPLFCKAGDFVEIITDNPGEWRKVVIIRNVGGDTIHVLWADLMEADV